ncbi:MAG: acyl-CoA synthetase [Ideonella sp.]|nr:acyl-CoA synthetase [Ideonella sp.]MCC7459571.1 acyl-CoA synthetase [Nitrospira sp.]
MPAATDPGSRAPARAHVLDRLIGAELPRFTCRDDVLAFEAGAPFAERVAAASTYEALQLGAAIDPAAPALHFLPSASADEPPLTWSHTNFGERVTQAANLFHALAVGAGDVVSLLLPLVPQAFVALFGAQAVGIANPVNPLLAPAQLADILRAARTRVLVTLGPAEGSEIWDKVGAIRPQLPDLKTVLVVGGAAHPSLAADDFDARVDAFAGDHLASGRLPRADDSAGYFHTGGTTGTPKLVRHTHANQVSQAWALRLMGLAGPGRGLLFGLPLFHVGGALTQGLATLANGGHIIVLGAAGWRHPNAVRNVWALVQRYRPPLIGAVPTVLAAALQVPIGEHDIGSLQLASGGGSAIPLAVIHEYEQRLHLPVLEVYGMTETSSVHAMNYPDMPRHAGSVGLPLPYSRTRVVKLDAEGRLLGDCAPNEIGVVAMAGPGVFGGYLSEAHNRGAFVEPGWVNSGDLGRLDEHGELWITGRAKDLIIRGAHNIDPAPLEELLYRHPAVALAALVGQPDAYAGELPVAYVQLKSGVAASADELLDHLRQHTPERAALPVALHFADPMPLTAVGKIFKPALRQDATLRVARRLLEGLTSDGEPLAVEVVADATHGQLIRVSLGGCEGTARDRLAAQVGERLGPLTVRHEIA